MKLDLRHRGGNFGRLALSAGIAVAFFSSALAKDGGAEETLFANPRETPARHAPPKVLGRDYWTFFYSSRYSDPSVKPTGIWDVPEIANLPMFKECGIVYWTGVLALPPGKATWRTVAENFDPNCAARFAAAQELGRPVTLMFHSKCCMPESYAGEIDLDHADYEAWKAKQKTLTSIRVQSEWGVGLVHVLMKRENPKFSEGLRKTLNAVYDVGPWRDRNAWVKRANWYMNRHLATHYGDTQYFESFRSANFLDHIAAARGAKTLVSETTNTSDWNSEYRWDVSAFFVRGAARQFGIPWRWYVAGFFNGPTKDGGWLNNSHCNYGLGSASHDGVDASTHGISESSERRVCYYAYLNGAGGVESESWGGNFFMKDESTGKVKLSPRGANFSAFHDFTRAHPGRGTTYAPVAVLVPLAQGYQTTGGKPWGFCNYTMADQMVDGVFFTVCPGFCRRELMKDGKEGNLHNSPFAQMYDVLVPDTKQDAAAFDAALAAYPAAVLTGDYPADFDLAAPMKRYVAQGGTLVLNAAYLSRGFGADFTGVADLGETFASGDSFVDYRGKKFPVSGRYDVAALKPSAGTTVVAQDAEGRPLVTLRRHGKGRVIVVAPIWMAPKMEHDADWVIDRVRNGKQAFSFTAYVLARLQHDLFPVRVRGDVEYGINRTEKGWWLWCFNNKGVTKFADAPQSVDPAMAARITVELGKVRAASVRELVSGKPVGVQEDSFSWRVPSGDVAVFEITEAD